MTQAPHAASYYAATRNDATEYPPLAGDLTVDVCIIGGGFSGLSTAIFLVDQGASVAVLETNRIGWGASGRNGGQVNGGLQGEGRIIKALGKEGRDFVERVWYRGHDIIAERIERFGIACDYKPGYIEAAYKPKHLAAIESYVEELKGSPNGAHLRLMDKAEIGKALGTETYAGGLYDSRNAHCHPLNLCLGEARGAASLGVKIFEGTTAREIVHGNRPVVVCDKGRITAGTIVLAGNAYHHLEQRQLGGMLFPAGTYIIATEPLPEEVARRINGLDAGVSDSRIVLDYYRLSADRRLLFGGLCQYANRDPVSITGALRPKMLQIWPELAKYRIEYEWGGHIGIVISRVPLVGRTARNVFYLQGYSGHGVNVSHIMSEVVARAIAGDARELEMLGRIPQYRVPTHPWIGSQLLAAGMTYYKMRDWM